MVLPYASTNEYTEVTVRDKDYYRQWAAKNKDKLRAAQKRHREKVKGDEELHLAYKEVQRGYRNTNYGRASRLYHGSLKRATNLGIENTLDIGWVLERLDRGTCEVTGIPFVLEEGRHPFAPSLDKTDPTLGYTKENTKVVVWCYNTAKGTWTHDYVIKLAEALCVKNIH